MQLIPSHYRGGAGADRFVMRADAAHDVIVDFDLWADQLDLSFYPRGIYWLVVEGRDQFWTMRILLN